MNIQDRCVMALECSQLVYHCSKYFLTSERRMKHFPVTLWVYKMRIVFFHQCQCPDRQFCQLFVLPASVAMDDCDNGLPVDVFCLYSNSTLLLTLSTAVTHCLISAGITWTPLNVEDDVMLNARMISQSHPETHLMPLTSIQSHFTVTFSVWTAWLLNNGVKSIHRCIVILCENIYTKGCTHIPIKPTDFIWHLYTTVEDILKCWHLHSNTNLCIPDITPCIFPDVFSVQNVVEKFLHKHTRATYKLFTSFKKKNNNKKCLTVIEQADGDSYWSKNLFLIWIQY